MAYDLVTRALDTSRRLQGIARRQVSATTARRLNEAAELTFTVPDGFQPAEPDVRLSTTDGALLVTHDGDVLLAAEGGSLSTGSYLQRVRVGPDGSETVATGRVSRRDVQEDGTIAYTAFLDAILLANNVTPANYTNALRNTLLEDFARAMVDGWRPMRADFATALARSNVDTTTEPGRVLLDQDASGAYRASGYIIVRFDADDIQAFKGWDRVRWEGDYYDDVSITMQYRVDGGAWSEEARGADPAGMGVSLAGVTGRIVDVRINLYTDDTETPAEVPEGETPTTFGFTPRVFGVEAIARTTGQIEVGTIDVEPDVFVRTVEADSNNALRLLQEACEETGHEFHVRDGKLHVAREVGADRTGDFILQDGRNARINVLRDDDSDLANRLHAYGTGSGLSRPYVFLEDRASIGAYGPYETTESFEATTQAELEEAARAWLNDHSQPEVVFEATAVDEHAIDLGDKVRIADPKTGTVVTTRVTEVTETEDAEGRIVTLRLGKPPRSLVQQVIDRAEEDKRREYELPLSPPTIRARRSQPGFTVKVGHVPRSRGVGFVIHYSATRGFEPSAATERARGRQDTWEFPDVQPGTVYYVRAAAFDRAGEVSSFTDEHPVRAGFVDPVYLDPATQEQLDDAAATKDVVDQNREVWDRAQSINEAGKLLTDYLEGDITREQLEEAVRGELDLIEETRTTLALDPDDPNQFAAVQTNAEGIEQVVTALSDPEAGDPTKFSAWRQTADKVDGVVAVMNDPESGDPSQYTGFRQTAQDVQIVAAEFDPLDLVTETGDTLVTSDGSVLSTTQPKSVDDLGVNDVYSRVRVAMSEIDLRVHQDDVVSSINLDPTGVRINGRKIRLTGDTEVAGDFRVSGGNVDIDGDTTISGMLDIVGDDVGVAVKEAAADVMPQVKMGHLVDTNGDPLPGLPSGMTHGLWGEYGTGVVIHKMPRLIRTILWTATATTTAMSAGNVRYLSTTYEFPGFSADPIEVPAGYDLIAVPAVHNVAGVDRDLSLPTLDRYQYVVVPTWSAEVEFLRSGSSIWRNEVAGEDTVVGVRGGFSAILRAEGDMDSPQVSAQVAILLYVVESGSWDAYS